MVRHEGAQEHAAVSLQHEGASPRGAELHEAHVAVLAHAEVGGGGGAHAVVGEAHERGGRRRRVLRDVVHGRRLAAEADGHGLDRLHQLVVAEIRLYGGHPYHVVLFHYSSHVIKLGL